MKNLKEISTRLEIAKKNIKGVEKNTKGSNVSSFGKALKISTELVAAVLIGSLFGFFLDSWFDTKPIITICFFFVGVAAGIQNVIRSAKKMNKNAEK